MITVNQIYEAMQAIAPLELAEHWDNPGLLVDCGGQVHRVPRRTYSYETAKSHRWR